MKEAASELSIERKTSDPLPAIADGAYDGAKLEGRRIH